MRFARLATPYLIAISFFALAATGCQSRIAAPSLAAVAATQPIAMGLDEPQSIAEIEAICSPPIGWRAVPIRINSRSVHQSWHSPTGRTAYGVIRFAIPLPVSPDTVLPFFLREMARVEGSASLLQKDRLPDTGGLYVLTESTQYRTHTTLLTSGFRGWVIYAGSLRNEDIEHDELELAQRARTHTYVGVSRQ